MALLRRDNVKSVCILRDVKLKNNSVWHDEMCLFDDGIQGLSFSGNDAGSMARHMMRDRNAEGCHVDIYARLSPLLPAPGWLRGRAPVVGKFSTGRVLESCAQQG